LDKEESVAFLRIFNIPEDGEYTFSMKSRTKLFKNSRGSVIVPIMDMRLVPTREENSLKAGYHH